MTPRRSITISAPAKINLGLEILRRRDDGYHEIRTVMAMIDLADTLRIALTSEDQGVHIHGMLNVPEQDNLIAMAIRAYMDETGIRAGYNVDIRKRIPSPGGLGGASSDAAAALLAVNSLHQKPLSPTDLARIAGGLGSDVPFFLGSPFALAFGTGTSLDPLPPVRGWVLLVAPTLEIGAKTPTLYRALQSVDFSDGSNLDRVAKAIRRGEIPEAELLGNAFTRPLYELAPHLKHIREKMIRAGAGHVALSGAGPAHYVLAGTEVDARALAFRMSESLGPHVRVEVAKFLQESTSVETGSA